MQRTEVADTPIHAVMLVDQVVTRPGRRSEFAVHDLHLGSNAFLKSTDTGETWKPAARIEGCDPRTLVIAGGARSVLYAGGLSDMVGSCFAGSIDGGESWSRYEGSIPGIVVQALAAVPGSGGTLFAAVPPASDAFVTKLDRQGVIVYSRRVALISSSSNSSPATAIRKPPCRYDRRGERAKKSAARTLRVPYFAGKLAA